METDNISSTTCGSRGSTTIRRPDSVTTTDRDYDPAVGKYIESDPIGLDGGSYSTYAYADGNPIPLGLWHIGDPLPQGVVDAGVGLGDGVIAALTCGVLVDRMCAI
jgi:RHS repeat-associated protein